MRRAAFGLYARAGMQLRSFDRSYEYGALEPYISHSKHYKTYVSNLHNAAAPEQLQDTQSIVTLNFNGGGGVKHAIFWKNPALKSPWLSAQRRSVSFLRATHAHGEKQGCYNDIEMKVTNFNNEDKGTTVLAGDVFDVPIRRDIVHRVVVWQLAKRRQGTHSTKTISEVSGTGRKPYKQKGTGQARHGTLRGPQFRHGATMHGPKPRDYSYNLPKKVRRLGLKIALSARVAEGKLLVLEDVIPPSQKTKDMANFIAGLDHSKRVLIVDGADKVNTLLCRSTGNLYAADVLPARGLNVYSILQHDTLIMSLDAIHLIENRMHTPINR